MEFTNNLGKFCRGIHENTADQDRKATCFGFFGKLTKRLMQYIINTDKDITGSTIVKVRRIYSSAKFFVLFPVCNFSPKKEITTEVMISKYKIMNY